MCLAAATGEWDAGLGDAVPAERVVLAGIRDLDPGERVLLEQSPATVIGASTVETLVAARAHSTARPCSCTSTSTCLIPSTSRPQCRRPAACIRTSTTTCSTRYSRTASWSGSQVTAFEAPEHEEERIAATETAMHVLEPFLDHLGAAQ